MDKLRIRGGRALHGEVSIAGAKNAALPELCAALLTAETVTLTNVPHLQDVSTMAKLIRHMGVDVHRLDNGDMVLNASGLHTPEAPYELVKTMRASVLALGPLLARFGHAKVSLPGGCAIGSRPVDQHIKGLQAMGAVIDVEHGYMVARLKPGLTRLKGARIATDMVTVTGTENFLMAACLAEGETVLENAAQEPEIPDLAELLIAMGAQISGHGSSRIHVQGVERLHGARHQVVADRIEAGTFLCAVAASGGDVMLRHARGDHLEAVIDKLRDAGVQIDTADAGNAKVTETIFENRFMHVNELLRLGAHISIDGKVAMVEGVPQLSGATVMATDLRASASLVIAGLVASGETVVDRIYHLDRGYDRMEEKLRALGADIERIR